MDSFNQSAESKSIESTKSKGIGNSAGNKPAGGIARDNAGHNSAVATDEVITATPTQAAMNAGATTIDLSADPHDFSAAINHIITSVQEARAANQKVILMLGESHPIIAHKRMAELVRRGLHDAHIKNPVIAIEQAHNFLEKHLPDYFPGQDKESFRARATQALATLKTDDPVRYRHLQRLVHASSIHHSAPITSLANTSAWIDHEVDTRFVDLARTKDYHLDITDPPTRAFIEAHPSPHPDTPDTSRIHTVDRDGIRLRNLWMAAQTNDILAEDKNDVVILKTGRGHLGGGELGGGELGGGKEHEAPYDDSLHNIFAQAQDDGIKIITVFPETKKDAFQGMRSAEAQTAMNDPDTIILRGGSDAKHDLSSAKLFERPLKEELDTLTKIDERSGLTETTPQIKDIFDWQARGGQYTNEFVQEIEAVTAQYAPSLFQKAGRFFGFS